MSHPKMNAKAILTAQGWRGPGHSLHPTSDNTGLKHHLLIRREGNDGRGLGANKDHKQEAWWMNAFDQALKGIDTSSGSMKQTVSEASLALGKITATGAAKYTGSRGLYTIFVRGGMLSGTVGEGLPTPPDSGAGTPAAEEEITKPRKESKDEKTAIKEAKRLKKAEKLARKEAEAKAAAKAAKKMAKEAMKAGETKEQRKARREARRARKEEKRRLKQSEG